MTDTEHNLETAEPSPQRDENVAPVEAAPAPEVSPEAETEAVAEVVATPEAENEVEAEVEATPEAENEAVTEEATPAPEAEVETTPEAEVAPEEDVAPASETPPPADEPRTKEGMNWFVLRVASNKEDYVRAALEKKVQIEGAQHLVGNIMVPTEKTKTLTKSNKVKITETKLYPGYIFVEMKLVDSRISQDVFFLIKETTGVGDFVGTAGKPTPMSNDEVDKMLYDSQAPEEVTEVKLEFIKGDHVSVKEGPFMGYEGTVDEIFPEKGVVRLLATVFGRQTQIDIEYWMIEKAE